MKRGHSSHIGLQAVILYDVGCVIDFNIFCTDCRMCSRREKEMSDKEGDAYRSWKEGHEQSCRRNFQMSSNAMEAEGAHVIFGQSEEKFRMRL